MPVVEASELGARFRDTSGVPGFLYWRKFCAEAPAIKVSELMTFSATAPIDPDIQAAYDAPFPDDSYMAGARKFPGLVPIFADDPEVPANREAWTVLEAFDKPFLTAFSDSDPVTAGGEKAFQERVPGARGREHPTIANGGHFLQEDQPAACVEVILGLIEAG